METMKPLIEALFIITILSATLCLGVYIGDKNAVRAVKERGIK
jgi:hypothetical protein